MEKFNFVGKNVDEHLDGTSRFLNNEKEAFMGPNKFPKEVEKTPNEIETINNIADAINKELIDLDLSPDFVVDPKQIHFFETRRLSSGGTYSQIDQQIEINKSKNKLVLINDAIYQSIIKMSNINIDKKLLQFETLLHEFVHSASFHKYFVTEMPETNLVESYRLGYRLNANDDLDYFRGLNEAVVQKTTQDILRKLYQNNEIQNSVHKMFFRLNHSYTSETIILEKIISKISKEKNEDKTEVWKRFEKGQFTGEMMHLRDIEKAYGPGSLRILASMNPRNTNSIKQFLYYTYFSTDKKNLKDSIARILLKKDKITEEKYNKHVNHMKKD